MEILEKLNRHPAITTGVTVGVIVVASIVIFMSLSSSSPKPLPPRQAYFTVDDGETYFPENMFKVAPFDHEGKKAVRVHVFSCDKNKTTWIGFLEKTSDEGVRKIDKQRSPSGEVDDQFLREATEMYRMVKPAKNPTAKWVSANTEAGVKIRTIACPHNDPSHQPMEKFE